MKIVVYVLTYNCADVLPWFLRHYRMFADTIVAWDDQSTDGTRELLKREPRVSMRDWPHQSGIHEDVFLAHWQEEYPKAVGEFDWVVIADPDEIIYAPELEWKLWGEQQAGTEVVRSIGYNMTGDGLPPDDGKSQIWEVSQMGILAEVYSKPVVFRPHIKINWQRGRHALENCSPLVSRKPWLKLLHYRFMGHAYTAAKNAKNYDRVGDDKGAAWSCAPSYKGEHSPQWAEKAKRRARNVLAL